jgi:ATP-binding cassette subfamily F protein 3
MIQADNLCIAYHGVPLLENLSFTVNPRERCALMGRNGSGKTTLLRLLTKQEELDSGTLLMPKGYKLGYLDQHIRFSKPTLLEEAQLGLKEEEKDLIYKAEALLFGLGFKEEDLDAAPALFSGGYQLRLHLAKVLLSEPNCLLLDEPTNYLDILSLRFLARFLQQFKGEMILISHDRQFLDEVTTHTLGLHRKKIMKCTGGTSAFFERLAEEEERHEKTRLTQDKKRAHLQSFVDRFGAKASKAAQANARKKALDRLPALEKLNALNDLNFSFHERPFYGRKLLELADVSFGYEDKEPLIRDLSLTIENHTRTAIIGKNGYGKSTLLKLIANELEPSQGSRTAAEQTAIGYFGQTNIERLHPESTIEEEIAAANPELNLTEAKGICGKMLFSGELSRKKIGVLSGGERSRVLLGKILARPCNLLLLDEPTHHLDVESIEALIDALEEFQGSLVLVTHSELILHRLEFHTLVVCHRNRQTLFQGNYSDFLDKVGWEEEESSEVESKKASAGNLQRAQIKTLENDLKKIEKSIEEAEALKRKLQSEMALLSERGSIPELQELSTRLEGIESALESAYQRFMTTEETLKNLRGC